MLAISLALLALGSGPADGPDAYQRAVGRALQRSRKELLSSLALSVDHSRWEDPWIVNTAHFEVRTTHSYLQARQLAQSCEFLRGELVKLLGEPPGGAGARQRIWVFPTIADYNRFGEQNGAEHSSMLGSFYSADHAEQPVVTYQNGNPTLLGMWVSHGATHQFLAQGFGPQRTLWVDEGLASYMALFWDWPYGARELQRLERTHAFVRLERLFDDPLALYRANAHERFIELGMLFHFLLNHWEASRLGAGGDPATGPFQEYLHAAVRGGDLTHTEFAQILAEARDVLEEDFRAHDFAQQ